MDGYGKEQGSFRLEAALYDKRHYHVLLDLTTS